MSDQIQDQGSPWFPGILCCILDGAYLGKDFRQESVKA